MNLAPQLERWRPHRHSKSEQASLGLHVLSRNIRRRQISKEFIYRGQKWVVRAVTTLNGYLRATRCIIVMW